jgi:hypothetical protein
MIGRTFSSSGVRSDHNHRAQPLSDNHWGGGRFYNPDDGKTYNVLGELVSDDLIVVRLFETNPFFGQNKTLERVPHGTSDGWC